MSILLIKNEDFAPDKEAVKAQRQWEQDGTVSDKYLRSILGDISKGVSAFARDTRKKKANKKKNAHPG